MRLPDFLGDWLVVGVSTNWFDLTRVLLQNITNKKKIEIALGCQMCGYKNGTPLPSVVEASVIKTLSERDSLFYNETIKPKALSILEQFVEFYNIDDIYMKCINSEDYKTEINWQCAVNWL